MDGGPELHWFNDRPEQQFTPLEIAAIEFGDALVASIETGNPIDPKYMDTLSTEAAKQSEHIRKMELARQKVSDEGLDELKLELLRDFSGGKVS